MESPLLNLDEIFFKNLFGFFRTSHLFEKFSDLLSGKEKLA